MTEHTFRPYTIKDKALKQFDKQIKTIRNSTTNHDVVLKAYIKLNQYLRPSDTKVLFITATAQAEANYYLIWQLIKINEQDIQKIVIISTDFSRKRGFVGQLKSLLSLPPFSLDANLVTELHIPNGKEETDINFIKNIIIDWIFTHHPKEIIFNITGGTKLISIAQDQVATLSPLYYCAYQSRASNQLIWYNRAYKSKQVEQLVLPEDISTRLKARGYIKQGGTSVLNTLDARDYVSVIHEYLQQDFEKTQSFISFMNYLCHVKVNEEINSKSMANRQESIFPISIKLNYNEVSRYDDYLSSLSAVDQPYLEYHSEGSKLVIKSEKAVQFLGGEWFEVLVAYFIFLHFSSQKQQVDVQIGLTFSKNSNGNEVDVAYLESNGYFSFLECKTVNWKNNNSPTTTVNEKLHKLASIASVAGLNSHVYFVSLYGLTPQSMQVAKELNIRIIQGKQLLNFTDSLIKI
ncbi:Card1-like endonuclease domain-containing protein [Psychrobacter sp. I-STPA6b]|uniref:Card1-like endonuclease domain-containing protein n=1 Tax=Psychrobacter sp. I-STPA6b TaxID=2585718 RepID=UPI001D0CB541|nr:DUF1887 family CARF protein [Psychrobacter sp. I-STPA6b]